MRKVILPVSKVLVMAALWAIAGPALAVDLNLTPFSGFVFNTPIGIDFHEPTGKLIMSVNYPSGSPNNLDLVASTGSPTQFSSLAGLTNEVKVATVRAGTCQGGFAAGEVFTGNGNAGQIVRISADGLTVQNPWVDLSLQGETALVRGSLFQDRFCAAGGDLIVVTGNEQNGSPAFDNLGNVWRITSAGIATKLATLGRHLEGVTTIVNNATTYGPLAGRIIAGDEDRIGGTGNGPNGRIYAINPNGVDDFFTVGAAASGVLGHTHYQTATLFNPEDLDVVRKNADFFGVDFGGGKVLTASSTDLSASNFRDRCGQILITQEFPVFGTSGLYALRWDSGTATFIADLLTSMGSTVGHWEHTTFASGEDCLLVPPQLNVVKTPDNGTFTEGSQVSFTIVISNPAPAGSSPATNVAMTDQLPGNGGLVWTGVNINPAQGGCTLTANLLSCNLGTIQPGGSVTVTVTSTLNTPAAACTSQPNPVALATADGSLTAQDSGSLTCSANLVTVTQGGWHATPHGNNPGTILNAYFTAHPGTTVVIGSTSCASGKTLTFTSANAIRAFLPAKGTPGVLAASATNPTTSAAGVFAGQVLALQLNLTILPSGGSLGSFVLTTGPAAGKTVAQVLADADKALGGCGLPGYVSSISQLNDVVTSINEKFDTL